MGVHRLHAANAKKLLDRMCTDLNNAILVYCMSEYKMAAASGWSIVSAYRRELLEKFYPSEGWNFNYSIITLSLLPDQSQIASAIPAAYNNTVSTHNTNTCTTWSILQYSNSYMYNEHTVMHILKLQDHNRSEYSTSNVSGLDSHKEIWWHTQLY